VNIARAAEQMTVDLRVPVILGELSRVDVRRKSPILRMAREAICRFEDLYPGIDNWFHARVVPGIRDGSRIGIVQVANGHVLSTGILKRGARTKLCHLNVPSAASGNGAGTTILRLLLERAGNVSSISFTAPESVWEQVDPFFTRIGALLVGASTRRYRSGDQEIVAIMPLRHALGRLRNQHRCVWPAERADRMIADLNAGPRKYWGVPRSNWPESTIGLR
jgi:hypothetical protein